MGSGDLLWTWLKRWSWCFREGVRGGAWRTDRFYKQRHIKLEPLHLNWPSRLFLCSDGLDSSRWNQNKKLETRNLRTLQLFRGLLGHIWIIVPIWTLYLKNITLYGTFCDIYIGLYIQTTCTTCCAFGSSTGLNGDLLPPRSRFSLFFLHTYFFSPSHPLPYIEEPVVSLLYAVLSLFLGLRWLLLVPFD